jgi:uncharacterized protein (DUF4415 family)
LRRVATTGEIVRSGATSQTTRRSKTEKARNSINWTEIDNLDDQQIKEAVARDPDAAPIAGDEFWKNARVVLPVPKQAISIRLDEDVLAFFKDSGPGYQSRINAVLRSYVDAKK